ncbi:MAG: excinuclease ABC subunit UvrB [Armatimonadota bacterium]|nr:excinuclease ABC subunit UvrB [Armatimonadota bacterium]
MPPFKLKAEFSPKGDQPQAIDKLVKGLEAGYRYQTLLGVTGSGKTFTMAGIIERVQRPTLVIAHNKTLAAQLCAEFRDFFPDNAVEYFVSYYDYYQPEAYIPQRDLYIEKDSSINEEIDRLRHAATQAILDRRDVIIVASVSCIYGLGSPEDYKAIVLKLRTGETYQRDWVLHRLVDMQFGRNQMVLNRGEFRVRGDLLEIYPKDEDVLIRVDFFGDEVDSISVVDPLTGEVRARPNEITVYAASHFVTNEEKLQRALETIEAELQERVEYFRRQGKLVEAERLWQRTRYDMEMIRETGFCAGIENYSRHLDGRPPGTPPHTLIEYFPKDFLVFIDESHQTIPQLNGMYHGDLSRKTTLVEYGFRLPSAIDNRPLKFHEFEKVVGQCIFVSATPGPYELKHSAQIVEQVIRPTGLIDPEVEVRPVTGQVDDLIEEIRVRTARGERVLVTTLTKKMAENLSAYLQDVGIKVHYLHSDIQTIERTEILRDLRLGVHDVIVGINLLREGLDLPEVSLVAILDADKEGFLRSETSLIQTIGRAARHVSGKVILYADTVTGSMQRAISETNRRRALQMAYNEAHGITPRSVQKAVRDLVEAKRVAETGSGYGTRRVHISDTMPLDEIMITLAELEKEMKQAAQALEFERAAEIRDEIARVKKILPGAAQITGLRKPPPRSRR